MKELIFEIEELIKNNFEVERLENTEHYNIFCYIYFYFKLNTKNKNKFKEMFQKIKEISEKHEFFALYKISKRLHGNGLVEICFKNKNNVLTEPPKVIYHRSPRKNRKKILKEGLIPQPFEKSRWRKDLNYYYEPAIFCSEMVNNFRFLFSKVKHDIWEINLTELNNKWFYDSNMDDEKYSFMTFEKINPEHLSLVEAY